MIHRSLLLLALLPSSALADWPAWHEASTATCEASYAARIADARAAIAEEGRHNAEHARLAPWFDAHCRFLTPGEIRERKLDDDNAFVCDTSEGRPNGLMSAAIVQHHDPMTVDALVRDAELNARCAPHDEAAGRPSLVFYERPASGSPTKTERLAWARHRLEVMCWQSDLAACQRVK